MKASSLSLILAACLAAGSIVGSDQAELALSSGAFSYDTREAGTVKTVTLPLSSLSLSGAQAANYILANTLDLTAGSTGTIGVPVPEPGLHSTEPEYAFGLKLRDHGHGRPTGRARRRFPRAISEATSSTRECLTHEDPRIGYAGS